MTSYLTSDIVLGWIISTKGSPLPKKDDALLHWTPSQSAFIFDLPN